MAFTFNAKDREDLVYWGRCMNEMVILAKRQRFFSPTDIFSRAERKGDRKHFEVLLEELISVLVEVGQLEQVHMPNHGSRLLFKVPKPEELQRFKVLTSLPLIA